MNTLHRTFSLIGAAENGIPLVAHGLWDRFLVINQGKEAHNFNRYNYDAMADLLIPRAVAYSAGLIDYFFRGRIEAEDAHYTEAATRRTT